MNSLWYGVLVLEDSASAPIRLYYLGRLTYIFAKLLNYR